MNSIEIYNSRMARRKSFRCLPLLLCQFFLASCSGTNQSVLPGWHLLSDLYEAGAISDDELAQIAYISSGRELYSKEGVLIDASFDDPEPLSEEKQSEILDSYNKKEQASLDNGGVGQKNEIHEYYGFHGGYYCVLMHRGFFPVVTYEVIGDYRISFPDDDCYIECWAYDEK